MIGWDETVPGGDSGSHRQPDAPATVLNPAVMSLRVRSSVFLSCSPAACDHGLHVPGKSGQRHHRDMGQQKQDQCSGDKEVNRAGRLLPTQQIHDCGKNGYNGGRHGETGPNHQREQKENDSRVRQPLTDIVGERLLQVPSPTQIVDDGGHPAPGQNAFFSKT